MRELPIQLELQKAGDPIRAGLLMRFFKTGPGQYGEGDLFRGLTVPATRAIAKRHSALGWEDMSMLLRSAYHEDRLAALLILVVRAASASAAEKDRILTYYLSQTRRINNWDLVDLSAPRLVGERLVEKADPALLFKLAASDALWERRIAIVASGAFIRKGNCMVTLALAEKLLADRHDLMHKATGWLLREVGKKDLSALRGFLERHADHMPRTMLRYAIEKMDKEERLAWMRAGGNRTSSRAGNR